MLELQIPFSREISERIGYSQSALEMKQGLELICEMTSKIDPSVMVRWQPAVGAYGHQVLKFIKGQQAEDIKLPYENLCDLPGTKSLQVQVNQKIIDSVEKLNRQFDQDSEKLRIDLLKLLKRFYDKNPDQPIPSSQIADLLKVDNLLLMSVAKYLA